MCQLDGLLQIILLNKLRVNQILQSWATITLQGKQHRGCQVACRQVLTLPRNTESFECTASTLLDVHIEPDSVH